VPAARGRWARSCKVGQALREGAGLREVLRRHPDLAVGADAMARALGEPPLHVARGRRRASKPLALGGSLVEELELRFGDGRAVDVRAHRGADAVRAQLGLDDGAARLGEIALVDDSSPLQQAGVLFYDTLLDDSAASHIAWGDGIPDVHRDYDPARPETLDGLPINHSRTHVDVMIGSPHLTVTGVCRDGTRRDILEGERWVL
jgi:aminopeptidase